VAVSTTLKVTTSQNGAMMNLGGRFWALRLWCPQSALTNGSIYERTFDEGVNLVRNHRTIAIFVVPASLARAALIVPEMASGSSDLKTAGFGTGKQLVARLSGAAEVPPADPDASGVANTAGGNRSIPLTVLPTCGTGVVANVTATEAHAPGYFTVFPCGQSAPTASNLNFTSNDTVSNLVAVGVGSDDASCIYSYASADAIADVTGFYGTGAWQPVRVTAADRGLS
jgi:hypothetical protein